jgi:glycogen operon protein
MNEDDWRHSGASVLGMHLRNKDDEVLVWFNRRIEPVVARLPDNHWQVGLVSDQAANVVLMESTATLTPRSVTALTRPVQS